MRCAPRCPLFVLVLVVARHGLAASIDIQVRDGSGRAVADAVVYAVPAGAAVETRGSKTVAIEQVDREFVPYASVIRTGTQVEFPNRDPIQHHVHSFSPAKTFEDAAVNVALDTAASAGAASFNLEVEPRKARYKPPLDRLKH